MRVLAMNFISIRRLLMKFENNLDLQLTKLLHHFRALRTRKVECDERYLPVLGPGNQLREEKRKCLKKSFMISAIALGQQDTRECNVHGGEHPLKKECLLGIGE